MVILLIKNGFGFLFVSIQHCALQGVFALQQYDMFSV